MLNRYFLDGLDFDFLTFLMDFKVECVKNQSYSKYFRTCLEPKIRNLNTSRHFRELTVKCLRDNRT